MDIELHIDNEVWTHQHSLGTKLPKYFVCWERVFEIKHGTTPIQYHACGIGLNIDRSSPVLKEFPNNDNL